MQGSWNAFRSAVLADDLDAVATYVHFPLSTRGSLDHCPDIDVTRSDFAEVWPQILSKRENGVTLREYIEHGEIVIEEDSAWMEGSFSVSNLEFARYNEDTPFMLFHVYWAADGC